MEWRKTRGLFNLYEVNEYSQIRKVGGNKIYATTINKRSGYCYVGVRIEGKCYCKKIHRLSAIEFIPNPKNLPQINHIDGNKQNNHISNLEWCTGRDNVLHYLRTTGATASQDARNKIAFAKNGGRVIINFMTNEIFPTLPSAAKTIGMDVEKLGSMLRGRCFNTTNFMYVNAEDFTEKAMEVKPEVDVPVKREVVNN